MESIQYFTFSAIVLLLIAVIILLLIFHRSDTRDLRDRLMARDFHDYSVGKTIQKVPPSVRADAQAAEEALGGISQEDRDMNDRLPVN